MISLNSVNTQGYNAEKMNQLQAQAQGKIQGQLGQMKLTPQQQQLLRQQQQQQMLQQQMKQSRPRLQNYRFATTSAEILRKYAKYPPSLNFHIYETHYRFNNSQDSSIIPKSSPMVKSFLEHVLREEIPLELSELIKDFSIKSYDGCLILQVYDHRSMIPVGEPQKGSATPGSKPNETSRSKGSSNPSTPSAQNQGSQDKAATPNSENKNSAPPMNSRPKTYRTLLRPTQISLYYDLLYHTDSALTKFTDQLSLQMESEILALMNRNIDLSVPLNPYLCDDYLKPEPETPSKVWDEKTGDWKMAFLHRNEVEVPQRKLHQEELVMHKSSEYEEIMLLLYNNKQLEDNSDKKLVVVGSTSLVPSTNSSLKPSKDTSPGDAKPKKEKSFPSVAGHTVVNTNTTTNPTTAKFMRLRYIEEIRKRKEAQKAQRESSRTMSSGSSFNNSSPNPSGSPAVLTAGAMNQNPGVFNVAGNAQRALNKQEMPNKMTQQQLMSDKVQALRAQQQAKQQMQQNQVKRQKKDPLVQSIAGSPNMYSPSLKTAQPPSNMGTPVMNGSVPDLQQRAQQIKQNTMSPQGQRFPQGGQQVRSNMQPQPQRPPQPQGSASAQAPNQSQPLIQQQIFQTTLSPQEQQIFRQLQSRMNAFALMGNTGIAPNRAQLTQKQQQQAIQQSKLIQQQLLQKFPHYFQRLRQYQLLQQQKQNQSGQTQHQAQAQHQMQKFAMANMSQNPQFNRNTSGKTLPGGMNAQQAMNQQMLQQMNNGMGSPDNRGMFK